MMKVINLFRSRLWLFLPGIACEIVYLFYLLYTFPVIHLFDYITTRAMGHLTGYSRASFLTFLIVFTFLFILFGIAWWQARHYQDRATLGIILGFGSMFAMTGAFVYPIGSMDPFLYIGRSLVMLQYDVNPMTIPPIRFAADPLMTKLTNVFSYLPSPYGPLGILLQALPVAIGRKNILVSLLLTKIMFSIMIIICAFLVYKILQVIAPRFAIAGATAVAWNPFTIFQYSVNSHNDIAMMLITLLAIFALLNERFVLALVLLVTSALIKFSTILLIPLFFIYSISCLPTWQKKIVYTTHAAIYSLTVLIGSFAFFWEGLRTFDRFFLQLQFQGYSFEKFLSIIFFNKINLYQAKLLAWILFGICFLFALRLAVRDFPSLLKGCFLALLAWLVLNTSSIQPWYFIWPILFAILVPQMDFSLAVLLLAYAGSVGGLIYQYAGAWGLYQYPAMVALVNCLVYLFFFLPSILVFVLAHYKRTRGEKK